MRFQILDFIAEKAFQHYENRRAAARNAALIAGELKANNEILVASMQSVIQAAFAAEKLSSCESRLTSLTIFLDEYENSPDDVAKLSEIDIESQYRIDTLDDADVRVAGLPSYASAGCRRISVLRLKSFAFPGDLQNAKNRAREYARHCTNTISLIHDEIKQRFSHVTHTFQPFGERPGWVCKYGYYTQEPQPAIVRSDGRVLRPARSDGRFWYKRKYFHHLDFSPDRSAPVSAFVEHVNDLRRNHIQQAQTDFETSNLGEVKNCVDLFNSFNSN